MEMTSCYHYGQDCSMCDDSDGVPDCFKSRSESCSRCGRTIDIDVGCIVCEHGNETEGGDNGKSVDS